MKPYYEEPGITIYHGDCREVLHSSWSVGLVLTDPPYNARKQYEKAWREMDDVEILERLYRK